MFHKLMPFLQKPIPYTKSTAELWDDDHISKGMLAAHLNPEGDGATRNFDFIGRSVNWLADTLPSDQYPDLLDLGCGPGIYAERFAEKNYRVTGVDFSERSIKYARKSAKENHLNIDYILMDYLKLSNQEKFDIATMIYCDFGVLSDQDRSTLLKKIYSALKPRGVIVFDVFAPGFYDNRSETKTWEYCETGFYSDSPYINLESFYRYDDCNTYLEQYLIITDNNIRCHNIWNHGFTAEELKNDLTATGFGNIELFSDISGRPFEEKSDTICVIAHKER